jgi:membrane protease YdiL (CAAX protease family)
VILDLVAGVGLALAPLAAVIPVAATVYGAVGDRVESPVVGVALFEVACLLVGGGYLLLAGDPPVTVALPTNSELLLALLAVPFPFALAAVSRRVLDRLGVEGESALSVPDGQLQWFVLVSLVLVGPAEELLYRGVVQGLLVQPLGTDGGVLLMGVLFGAVHYPSYGAESLADVDAGVVAGGLQTAVAGVLYGALYVATGNLLVPVVTHSLYDAALFVQVAGEQRHGDEATTEGAAEDAQTSTENSS